jgi:hypothetical protein
MIVLREKLLRKETRVGGAEDAVQHEQDDLTHADLAGLRSIEAEKLFQEMLVDIRDSLSDHGTSDDWVDVEDEDEE